ncbi:MAG: hypothetical protein JJLCMIEE_01888 [Acidimicrobiales bacterium]|nr:hypothetical protein [Acidimicrobiales bacterium]
MREVTASFLAAFVFLAAGTGAAADSDMDGDQPGSGPPEISASVRVVNASGPITVHSGGPSGGGGSGSGEVWDCYYFTLVSGVDHLQVITKPIEGHTYHLTCYVNGQWRFTDSVVYSAADPTGGVGLTRPALVRAALDEARARLTLPDIDLSPIETTEQLVNLDTWMWIAGGTDPISVTAEVDGWYATTTATPVSVTFDPGDGSAAISCPGGGTPYDFSRPAASQRSGCTHEYTDTGSYTISATVVWAVSWTTNLGPPDSGTEPDETTVGTLPVTVTEAQPVLTR